ncbi:hypothetical protein C1280_07920 [Gemmata obscuriglobus]|uniref:Uncharacterized protein n=1 Tax=Gemmata obscuriglobus TaxID=114 RepID=A0A2Z3GY44_9BACT|nr:hypothetical protein C1280_07920 [Gemmata obscuriglobus]
MYEQGRADAHEPGGEEARQLAGALVGGEGNGVAGGRHRGTSGVDPSGLRGATGVLAEMSERSLYLLITPNRFEVFREGR